MTTTAIRGRAPAPAYAAPLRAVDVVSCSSTPDGVRVLAEHAVGADPETLRGHFPGLPIYPGVYVLESLAQAVTAAVAFGGGRPLRLREVRSARFLAPLLAGDRLHLDIEARPAGGAWQATARCARADGTPAAEVKAVLSTLDGATLAGEQPVVEPALCPAAGALDHAAVRALLPQRHPLLLVDRVLGIDAGRAIWAEKAVTATEPCYRHDDGHWPADADAYPIPLLLESLGQTAALLWLRGAGPVAAEDVLMFVAVRGYRVTGAAYPGDVLRHVVELTHVKADTAFASGGTWAGGHRIATVDTLVAVRRPRSVLGAPRADANPSTHQEEETDDSG